jgi:serine/threonine protein kinase
MGVSSIDFGMEASLAVGTLLQNRYQLVQLLGQGGFARTYLAQDHGRFGEYCVLKEFIPNQQSTFLLEKAREMFQREATILYQIQHGQIPQFRATFEAQTPSGAHLFLVQDYVAGPTYRQWLSERQEHGMAFSEAEVRQLMQQILPVLSYLHYGGIVHRDISPENLILRLPDHVPVLIDFGVVKEIASRLHGPESGHPGTAVGKLGYAPIEQLQTGRSYPSSDLYSLAVTVVVLLTGSEPKDLFDDQSLTWRWQDHDQVEVKRDFAELLNRMLSPRPGDRLQSANEVLSVLQTLPPPSSIPTSTVKHHNLTTAVTINLPTAEAAAARKPLPPSPQKPLQLEFQQLMVNTPTHQQPWQRQPLAYLAILGAVLTTFTALALWWLDRQPQPQTAAPGPTLTSPTPLFNPLIVPGQPSVPTTFSRPLNLAAGDSITITGSLQLSETHTYEILVLAGQQLHIQPQEVEGLTVTLLDPDQNPVPNFQVQLPWSRNLQRPGLYRLQVQSPTVPDAQSGAGNRERYQLTVGLLDPMTMPSLGASPGTSPRQPGEFVIPPASGKITFAANQRFQNIRGQLGDGQRRVFIIPARRGQTLSAVVINGFVTLNLRAPNGRLLANGSSVLNWQGKTWKPGNYQVEVVAPSSTAFELKLGLR